LNHDIQQPVKIVNDSISQLKVLPSTGLIHGFPSMSNISLLPSFHQDHPIRVTILVTCHANLIHALANVRIIAQDRHASYAGKRALAS